MCAKLFISIFTLLLSGSMSKAEFLQHRELQHDDTNDNSNNKHLAS